VLLGVFIAEGDFAVFEGKDTVIGDRDAVDVAGEIRKHLIGTRNGTIPPSTAWRVLTQVVPASIASVGSTPIPRSRLPGLAVCENGILLDLVHPHR
jgi:hypothetical protein